MLSLLLCCVLCTAVAQEVIFPTDLTYETFLSPAVPLRSGQIANTPGNTVVPMPKGPIAIGSFISDVVDDSGNSVPLSEVYVHHWLIYATKAHFTEVEFNVGACPGLPEIFGIGAELRHAKYIFPQNYTVITDGTETWSANLHFIRTTNVPDVQSCIECRCDDSDPPLHNRGEVGCCPNRGMCWGMKNSTIMDTKNYYLKYTVGYTAITPNLIPVEAFSFDITAKNTYDCEIQYQIPELLGNETQTNVSVATVPSDFDVVLTATHLHIGGELMTVDHLDSEGNYIQTIANAIPIYGTGGPLDAGNETGYLVDIPYQWFSPPIRLHKGDQLKLTAVYSGRTIAGGHHWHSGVMGILLLYGQALDNDKQCIPTFNKLCNPPPYFSSYQCGRCAARHNDSLNEANCNQQLISQYCKNTGGAGNIPSPVKGLSLSFDPPTAGPPYTVTLTGQTGGWFGIGWNPNAATMQGATAWVYEDDGTGHLQVRKRQLGNHYGGTVIASNLATSIEVNNATTTVQFVITEDELPQGSYNCVLFAHGSLLNGMTLQFHGSFFGTQCDI